MKKVVISGSRYEIKPNYNLACEYLIEWIPRLNDLYELQKSFVSPIQSGDLGPRTKTLLPVWDEVGIAIFNNI